MTVVQQIARWRVPLGFVSAAVAFWLAHPSWRSLAVGLVVAVPGEVLRVWAAGHIDKGREITRSGPYRYVRHPLYLGSTLLGVGFGIATRSAVVLVLTLSYLSITLVAAMRSEEALLDTKFAGAYAAYRAGLVGPVTRPFSWVRVAKNREYRAVLGLVAAFAILAIRALR